jgi:hypothetical protein
MKKISSKEWLSRILKNLAGAIGAPMITYIIYPDMTSKKGWLILGISLFITELTGTIFDVEYGYKQKVSDWIDRLFGIRKKKKD